MPGFGPWTLDEQLLRQARDAGRLTLWEFEFYNDNYGKWTVSEKEQPIKRCIEQMTLPNPWFVQENVLQKMVRRKSITRGEMQFYLYNTPSRRVTVKQGTIKWKIEDIVQPMDKV